MLEGFDNFELAAVVSVIRSYENVMGLSAQEIAHDSDGIVINWAYPDGIWAGTTCWGFVGRDHRSRRGGKDRPGTHHRAA